MSFRFVIIDDAPFIRELLKQIAIQNGGLCIGEAESGAGGLELIKRNLPDLVFLDLVMPGKSGLDIIAEAKLIWPDLKIIACSTLDDERWIKKALELGVDKYLTKPFSKEQISDCLRQIIPSLNQQKVIS